MKPDTRYPPIAQPTEERTADPVPADADTEDVVARTGRGEDTPRRYDEGEDEDVRPADDSPLNSKI